jgi:hypothetical protein
MKDFKIYYGIASVFLILYIVAQYNKPAPINWSTTLNYKDKIPYGTYILYHELNRIFPGAAIKQTNLSLYEGLTNSKDKNAGYIIIAKKIDVSKTDYRALEKYLRNGNSVFMSALAWESFLSDTLKIETQAEFRKKNTPVNFSNPRLKQEKPYVLENGVGDLYFSRFDTTKAIVLGKNGNGNVNFLSFKYGAGTLYLCANPQVFTNVNLLTSAGADYAAKALSYLPETNKVYWDEFQNGDIPEDTSPMRVFFANPNLQWAYYLSLATLLFFVLYEIKRRQRIIPVIDPLPNSTLEFVNVVGQVYYEQRDNRNICAKMILYLMDHLRTAFQLKTALLNQEFITHLSQKTGIEPDLASGLVNQINYVSSTTRVTDQDLILLNQLIEKFYKQSAN